MKDTKDLTLSEKYIAIISELIAPISVGMMIIYFEDRYSAAFIIYYLIAIIFSLVLQTLIGRKRPLMVEHLKKFGKIRVFQSEHSFPSIHATAMGIMLPLLFLTSMTLFIIWLIWIIFIAWTRVYLKMHYISDVFAGSVWGIILGVVILSLI